MRTKIVTKIAMLFIILPTMFLYGTCARVNAQVLMKSQNYEIEFLNPITKTQSRSPKSEYLSTPLHIKLLQEKKAIVTVNEPISLKLENNIWNIEKNPQQDHQMIISEEGKLILETNTNTKDSKVPTTICNEKNKCSSKDQSVWLDRYTGWGFQFTDFYNNQKKQSKVFFSLRTTQPFETILESKIPYIFKIKYIPSPHSNEALATNLNLTYESLHY